jgi:hypothetical protein
VNPAKNVAVSPSTLRSAPKSPVFRARTPRSWSWPALALVAAFASASPARAADELGSEGRIIKIEMRGPSSDDRSTAQGSITIRVGGKSELYSWGGSSCPASKPSDQEIGMLERAFHNRNRTLVTPRFKSGETSGTRCLVGFELRAG